jgi:hypothetical protein
MLRFTIRDLLWLTVVMALAACWYKDRLSMATTMAAERAALAAKSKQVDARAEFAIEVMRSAKKFGGSGNKRKATSLPEKASPDEN